MPQPIWQTGSALELTIDAESNATIDISALVSGAVRIEWRYGLQRSWMAFDGAVLTLTDAPAYRDERCFRVGFRAYDSRAFNADSADADFTITLNGSVLASLHSTLFFAEPINYEDGRVTEHGNPTTVVSEISDNDYTTFSSHTDFDIDVRDAAGNATAFDYVFIKAKGTDITYSLTPGGVSSRVIPTSIDGLGGGSVSTVVNGFTHDLFPLSASVSASSVRLQITGTGLEVYAVMLLKLGFEIEHVETAFEKVDRAGVLHTSPEGVIERDTNSERFKWEGACSCFFTDRPVDEFMDWSEDNLNFTFARQFSRHPEDVYPASFGALEMPNGYLGIVKSNGEFIDFRVSEQ